MKILENEELKRWTFWKIGGPADYFCQPSSIDELKKACEWADSKGVSVTVLGGGTNVLVSDLGIRGLVIATRSLSKIETREENGRLIIIAEAGVPKSELTKVFLKAKLAPALFLCGLPGDVGGGIVMNAGVGESIVPREFVEITDWFEVLRDGNVIHVDKEQAQWSYRHTDGWQPGIVIRAGLSWPLETVGDIGQKVKDATKMRVSKQPLNMPSCGSTFKNPPGHKAGALIEQSGLKGFQIGGAQVSPKHANFIVNLGNAKASEVDRVIKHVQKTVLEKFHVALDTEVKYLGQW